MSTLADNRIARRFADLKASGSKAFITYFCAGDPDLAATERLVPALDAAGVDIVELGVPFSDPMADGTVNQAASERGLASGTTLRGVLASIRAIRASSQVPILLYTYLNPIFAYGLDAFAADAVEAGVDGVLLLDLPPDEDAGVLSALRSAGLAPVCLATPNTEDSRRSYLVEQSEGFLYYVCRLGVTGERDHLPDDLKEQVARLRASGDAPICIGFGISTPEQAALAAGLGDGVVVGSHLVRLLAEHSAQGGDPVPAVAARVRELADAVHGAG
jgi:tryptophan synthase alpha chain